MCMTVRRERPYTPWRSAMVWFFRGLGLFTVVRKNPPSDHTATHCWFMGTGGGVQVLRSDSRRTPTPQIPYGEHTGKNGEPMPVHNYAARIRVNSVEGSCRV